jgi:hypothetical protein
MNCKTIMVVLCRGEQLAAIAERAIRTGVHFQDELSSPAPMA